MIASIALSWPLVPRKGEPNRAIAETETESVAAVEEGAPVRGTTQPNRQIASEQPTVPVVSQPAHTSVTLPVQPVQQTEPAQVVVHTTPAPTPVSPQVPVQQVAAQRPEAPAQDMNAQALSPVGSERASARESVPDPLASEQFFSAVKSGNLGVVKALIQRKAVDPNFTLDRGNTALMYASANGNLSIVKYLVSLRVAINARDPNGTTALMWAVYKGRTEVAKFLVSKGADVRLRRDDGDTALDIAKRWKRWDIAEVLQEASEREQSRKPASDRKRSRRR